MCYKHYNYRPGNNDDWEVYSVFFDCEDEDANGTEDWVANVATEKTAMLLIDSLKSLNSNQIDCVNNCVNIYINDKPAPIAECHSVIEVLTWLEVKVHLWALAKQVVYEYAVAFVKGTNEPHDNVAMRSLDVPRDLREAVDAEVYRLNESCIEALVTEALNSAYSEFVKYGAVPDFIEIVKEVAGNWAKDCYQEASH